MKLYHVSPYSNNGSIGRFGLLPEFATSSVKRVYAVQWGFFAWAVAHTSMRKERSVDSLECWVAECAANYETKCLEGAGVVWKRYQREIWYTTDDVQVVKPALFDVPTLLSMWAAGVEPK